MKYRFSACVIAWLICFAGIVWGADPALVIDSAGNTRFIKRLIFTKDGGQLISVGDDKVIRVWDVKTGKTTRTIRDQVAACGDCKISSIALSPDNKHLAVGGKFPGADAESRFAIYLYNFETGQRIQLLRGHQARVNSLTFSSDNTRLASGSVLVDEGSDKDKNGSVRLWKAGPQGWEASNALPGHIDAVASLAFSPDGNTLVSGGNDAKLIFWNLTANPVVGRPLLKHNDVVFGVVFSPDGRFIVSGGLDRKINVWDAEGKFLNQLAEQSSGVTSMAVSPNKDRLRLLVGLENGSSSILSLPDGNLVAPFKGGDDKVYAVDFSSADENLVASSGGFNGEIWLWRADGAKPDVSKLAGMGLTVWKVGFAKDGNSISFGTQHSGDQPNAYGALQQVIRFRSSYDRTTGQVTEHNPTYRISLRGNVQSSDNFYSEITRVGNYELKTRYGQTIQRRVGDRFEPEQRRLNELFVLKDGKEDKKNERDASTGRTHRAFTFTPDGKYFISAGEGGYLALYETKEPKNPLHLFEGHTNDVWSVAVSPDGRFVVSGSSDQTIKLWDIKYRQYLLSIFVASDLEWVAWLPQGYFTASSQGDRYIGWQVEQLGNEVPRLYAASQFRKTFYRPDVISQYLQQPDIETAISEANEQRLNADDDVSGMVRQESNPQDILEILPPKIQIVTPQDSTVQESILPVEVVVSSDKLPVTEVSIAHNGIRKGTFTGELERTEKSQEMRIKMLVALDPGDNILVVLASNGKTTSKPEVRRIKYVPAEGSRVNIEPRLSVERNSFGMPAIQKLGAGDRTTRSEEDFAHARRTSGNGTGGMLKASFGVTRDIASTASVNAAPAMAPRVTLVEPEDGLVTDNDNLTIRAVAFSADESNLQIRVLLNGREFVSTPIFSDKVWVFQIPLRKAGENILIATVSDGTTSSQPETRKLTYNPRVSKKPNLIFLGIGISSYQGFEPSLDFAHADAKDLAAVFCPQKGENQLFNDVKARFVTNAQADRTSILKALDWLNNEAKYENDVRVLLLSGHGGRAVTNQYYFFAHGQTLKPNGEMENEEINSVSWNSIWRAVAQKPGKVLLFIDTCRAGSINLADLLSGESVATIVFFGASGPQELSQESRDLQHGAFTQAVIEGLRGDADSGSTAFPIDGKISPDELNIYIKQRVSDLTGGAQNPAYLPNPYLPSLHITASSAAIVRDPNIECPKEGIVP